MDIEILRQQLMDYYGTAMSTFPIAMMELSEVENASDEEIIEMAESLGWL